ncbi:MAG: hypothetical protein HND47_19770 [Chloroflexi bacterium]|nr:hypothetical protein [Chloroflexota bacterium]
MSSSSYAPCSVPADAVAAVVPANGGADARRAERRSSSRMAVCKVSSTDVARWIF